MTRLPQHLRELERVLRPQGWALERLRRHYRFVGPGGELVVAHGTASDHRSHLNLRADLRRHGAAV